MNNIFVGNLSFDATKEDVQKLFEPFGTVNSVVIVEGKKGKSRGYGFVDMPNEEERNKAITELNDKEVMWRKILVSHVVPKSKDEQKPKKFRPVEKKWTGSRTPRPRMSGAKSLKPLGKMGDAPRPSRDDKAPSKFAKTAGDGKKKGYPRQEKKPWTTPKGIMK